MFGRRFNRISQFGWLFRATWLLLFVAHFGWFIGSMRESGSPVARLGLAATLVFFALKTADVACLRMRLTRRSFVSAILVVVLLHVGAVDRSLNDSDASQLTYVWLPVAASVSIIVACLRPVVVWTVFRRLATQLGCARGARIAACAVCAFAAVRHHLLQAFILVAPLRAPPAV